MGVDLIGELEELPLLACSFCWGAQESEIGVGHGRQAYSTGQHLCVPGLGTDHSRPDLSRTGCGHAQLGWTAIPAREIRDCG